MLLFFKIFKTMNDKYFEGTLQLRNCKDEVVDYVERHIIDAKVGVAKKTCYKNGFDYKLSSNKFLLKMNSELPKVFSGKCTLTRRIFTRDKLTSKDVYRLTLLFEQYAFKAGDVVEYKGEKVKILSTGARVTVRSIETGRKFFLSS